MTESDARVDLLADLADPLRFAVVERLERGSATATELAALLDASPTQLANHLKRLRDNGLVVAERRGRHSVYSLADPAVRDLISLLNGMRPRSTPRETRILPAGTCYDHLAGRVSVELYDALIDQGGLVAREGEGEVELGPRAQEVFARFGVDAAERPPRRLPAFACFDSYEGRPHLGGSLGADLVDALRDRGWIETSGEGRSATVTPAGRRALRRRGVALP